MVPSEEFKQKHLTTLVIWDIEIDEYKKWLAETDIKNFMESIFTTIQKVFPNDNIRGVYNIFISNYYSGE